MKLLVTGGAGFIGGNFIHYTLREHPDDSVVCLDSLTYAGNIETLAPALDDPRFVFARASVTDSEAVCGVFERERPDAVVNFAAETHVDRSINSPAVFVETNVVGAQVLLDACRRFGGVRFHQVGTDEVYGDLPLDRPELLFTEDTPVRASSPYSASKAAADLLALAYFRTFGLPVTVSRCSNNYGPYQFPEKLIPLMLINALAGRPLPVYGNGSNVRDWLFVDDHCAAIDTIIRRGRPGEVYNVGGNNERTNLQIVDIIIAALGQGKIEFVSDRAGHDLRYAVDSSKLRDELGWRPATSFDAGMARTIKWYLDNREWWERIMSGEYTSRSEAMYGIR